MCDECLTKKHKLYHTTNITIQVHGISVSNCESVQKTKQKQWSDEIRPFENRTEPAAQKTWSESKKL